MYAHRLKNPVDHQDPGVPAGMGEQPDLDASGEVIFVGTWPFIKNNEPPVAKKPKAAIPTVEPKWPAAVKPFGRFSDSLSDWQGLAIACGIELPAEANEDDFRCWRNACIGNRAGFRPMFSDDVVERFTGNLLNEEVPPWDLSPFKESKAPREEKSKQQPEERRARAMEGLAELKADPELLKSQEVRAIKRRDAILHALIDTMGADEGLFWDMIETVGWFAGHNDLREGVLIHFIKVIDKVEGAEVRRAFHDGLHVRLGDETYCELLDLRLPSIEGVAFLGAGKKPVKSAEARDRQLRTSQAGPAKGPTGGSPDLRSNPEMAAKRQRKLEQRKPKKKRK